MKILTGKRVLITGGAQGMGKQWASKFLDDGAEVILWDLNEENLKRTKEEFEKKYSKKIEINVIDINDREKIYKTRDELVKNSDWVDVLVNNAGIVKGGEFLTCNDNDHARIIQTNLISMMWMIKAFLPGMLEKKEAHIINVSSAAGLAGIPFMASYSASKWGVIGLTESIKLELIEIGHKNIKFTLLCPGYINTGMFNGVKDPLFLKILDPVKLIDKAYKKFKKNKYMVMEPFFVKLVPLLRGVVPNSIFHFFSKLLGISGSMKNWKGH
jgi:all-trans-retinol dehydrogenase (NAD+)